MPKVITAAQFERQKRKFRPGMRVRNTFSGNIGVLRADPDDPRKLDMSGVMYLPVDTTFQTGKRAGKIFHAIWSLRNVEVISGSLRAAR